MQRVFVIDANKEPLMPCRPGRARRLLKAGRAAMFKRYPFTIIVKDLVGGERLDLHLKIDPGAKTIGLALVVAYVPRGKRVGKHAGRTAVKANGSFTVDGLPDIYWKTCRRTQAADGYDYHTGGSAHSAVA